MLICENINKIYKKKEYQIIGIFTIAIVVLLYSYNYFANTFPYSDGWFVNYVELLKMEMFHTEIFFIICHH